MEPKTFEIVKYIGKPILTRGDLGDEVRTGRIDPDGGLFVWDSTYGWSFWSVITTWPDWEKDWQRTGEMVEPVEAQW